MTASNDYLDRQYSRHAHDCDVRTAPPIIARYRGQYPDYCRSCNATGYITYPGTRYYADGSGEPDYTEDCPHCIGQNKCPRCGSASTFKDEFTIEGPCEICGFNFQPTDSFPYPEGYSCSCGLDALSEDDQPPYPPMPW